MTEELFRRDAYLKECQATVTAVDGGAVLLDRTVFYVEGGGQPGDSGHLRLADGSSLAVVNTQKGEAGIRHILEDAATPPPVGSTVTAAIDWDRRYRHMRMHSCLHLLCALVDGGVTGGQVASDRGRLDFDLGETKPDKVALTDALNRLVSEDQPVHIHWLEDAELDAQPELVRTMSVAPPRGSGRVRVIEIAGTDRQPCGGTHVARTGEIGRVLVRKIENKGKRNRRVNIVFAE